MCGYAGYLIRGAEPPGERVLHEMADVLAHRGPDDRGFYAERVPRTDIHVGLGHRRLAVIDVAGGSQPMSTDGGRLWIVYNGEVYNFREIRSSLEEEGVRFRTRSDTEVVLELYRRRGPGMLESLRGMFSFAIWDTTGWGRSPSTTFIPAVASPSHRRSRPSSGCHGCPVSPTSISSPPT